MTQDIFKDGDRVIVIKKLSSSKGTFRVDDTGVWKSNSRFVLADNVKNGVTWMYKDYYEFEKVNNVVKNLILEDVDEESLFKDTLKGKKK